MSAVGLRVCARCGENEHHVLHKWSSVPSGRECHEFVATADASREQRFILMVTLIGSDAAAAGVPRRKIAMTHLSCALVELEHDGERRIELDAFLELARSVYQAAREVEAEPVR